VWQDVFAAEIAPGSALAIGNFDGVHMGHRAVVAALRAAAEALGTRAGVLVPDPHPLLLLGRSIQLLTPLQERGRLLRAAGAQDLWRLPFARDVAALAPEEFVRSVILERIRPRRVVVGFNFSYGADARGNPEALRLQLEAAGIALEVVAPQKLMGQAVSSSRIRAQLLAGDVEGARVLLGRPYSLQGEVRPGHGRGRTLGFPTANVHCGPELLSPGPGVYAVRLVARGETWPGVCNLGPRPTFGEEEPLLEVHLLDFSGDLYGERVEVAFRSRLRGQTRFAGIAALERQISEDCLRARDLLTADPCEA